MRANITSALPLFTVLLFASFFCGLAAHAANLGPGDRSPVNYSGESRWGVGLVFSAKKSPYVGVGNDQSIVPLLRYENKYVRFFGNTLDVKLPSTGSFDFSLRAMVPFGEGYKASDSSRLRGMEDRKVPFDLGGRVKWRSSLGDASLEYLYDVSGHSKGSKLKLGFERSYIFDRRFEVMPHLGLTRENARCVDYYYGVEADETTAARPEYSGKATTVAEFGVRFGYVIDAHQRLSFDVTGIHRGSGISNSPIVTRSSTPSMKLGYLYNF